MKNFIIYGFPGSGKTFFFKNYFMNSINNDIFNIHNDKILYINSSDEKGVDIIRNLILPFCSTKNSKNKIVIIDDADLLTDDAQSFIRIIIQNKSITFILITNTLSKIAKYLLSNCFIVFFNHITLLLINNIFFNNPSILSPLLSKLLQYNINSDIRSINNILYIDSLTNQINSFSSLSSPIIYHPSFSIFSNNKNIFSDFNYILNSFLSPSLNLKFNYIFNLIESFTDNYNLSTLDLFHIFYDFFYCLLLFSLNIYDRFIYNNFTTICFAFNHISNISSLSSIFNLSISKQILLRLDDLQNVLFVTNSNKRHIIYILSSIFDPLHSL